MIFILLTGLAVLLSGCSPISAAQLRNITLPNGRPAIVDKTKPPINFNCHQIMPIKQFVWKGNYIDFHDDVVDYIEANQIKTNYIYLQPPSLISNRSNQGKAYFYYCTTLFY